MADGTRLVHWVHRHDLEAGRLGIVDGLRRVVGEVRRTHPSVRGRELRDVRLLHRAGRVRITLDFAP